ncbi:MAG: nodulation protein NfeD [Acidobacteriota bacterium]
MMARLTFWAAVLCGMTASAAPKVIAMEIGGMVHPITAEILGNAIAQAESGGADAVLLRINTPGGLLDATREINAKIIASKVPVIAYVTPSGGRAASAGFFILQAADVAAMAPGTNTGAATPVAMGGGMDEVMRRKVENDTSAWLRGTVEKRGRNAELAETTIREARAFTEEEALRQRLVDLIAKDEAALFAALEGREITRFDGRKQVLHLAGAEVSDYELTWRESIIRGIADPNVGIILLIAGALALYVEFSAPGLIVPGVAGGISVLLGLSSLAVLPINWAGAALLLLSFVLFVMEAHVTSHGVLGVGGAIAMALGATLLIDGPPEMRIRWSTALAVTLPFAAITMFLLTIAVRARRNKVMMGAGALLEEIGEARTALDPAGKVLIRGEYWDAESVTRVEVGGKVRVLAVEGLRLRVEPQSKG